MFVVVALSSVVRGINESFARDVEAAGPTSFFVYRRPIGGFQSCDPPDPNSCPERRNPAITNDEALGIERLPIDLRRHAARRQRARRSSTRIESLERRRRVLHAELDRRRRRRHLPRPQLHLRGERRGGARRDRERQARRVAVRRLRSDRQGDLDRRRAVHGDRPLSLHGEPDGHADVGGRRRFAEGDRAVRDGPSPHATSGCAATTSSSSRATASPSTRRSTTSPRICAAHRGLRPTRTNNFAIVTQDRLLDDLQPSCSAPSSSSASRCRRSGCSSAASA